MSQSSLLPAAVVTEKGNERSARAASVVPFACAIFSGAFLLFQVQPLIGKYILPWFGGGPGVWTTCLLFFQAMLFGGYAYAHLLATRLPPKKQVVVHVTLVVLSLALLPIVPAEGMKPTGSNGAEWQILQLLLTTIGLPYFVLSSTGPMMQRWFSETHPGRSPYRLYALSNAGSLLALISFPLLEAKFTRHTLGIMWSFGLVLFAALCTACALRIWRMEKLATPRVEHPVDNPAPSSLLDRGLWLTLPAVACVLLVATTNKVCQEVAVIPFLWALPLSLYLVTLIVCFDHTRWYHRGTWTTLLALGVGIVVYLLKVGNNASMGLQIVGYCFTLLAGCMVCHGELFHLRPAPRDLTFYYLAIAAGGALGGFLVAIVAPHVFRDYYELQLGFWALSALMVVLCWRLRSGTLAFGAGVGAIAATVVIPVLHSYFGGGGEVLGEVIAFYRRSWLLVLTGVAVFIYGLADSGRLWRMSEWQPRMAAWLGVLCLGLGFGLVWLGTKAERTDVVAAVRNFYGTVKVLEYGAGQSELRHRALVHGSTIHGVQYTAPHRAMVPTTYYGEGTGIALAMEHIAQGSPRKVGIVGLGTGSIVACAKPGDEFRMYEINPVVVDLARSAFTYLERYPGKIDVVIGDGRLELEREAKASQLQGFDLLVLDAFNSDAVPVHLLTEEAFTVYLRHLKPDGVIAVNISNRFLDLRPIVRGVATRFDLQAAVIPTEDDHENYLFSASWVLLSKNRDLLAREKIRAATESASEEWRPPVLWTDDYASLYAALR